jgi:single-strand DNA-binding protein
MNKVILLGRLARDPDSSTTQTGKKKVRMTIAVDRPKAKDGTRNADFIGLVAWEKTAEFAETYLAKGQRILVEGRITTGSYEKDGEKRYTTDVNVDRIEFADSKRDNANDADDAEDYGDDDIPM